MLKVIGFGVEIRAAAVHLMPWWSLADSGGIPAD
jgi:hypothetical protein